MTAIANPTLDLSAYEAQLARALAYTGGSHTLDDVAQMIEAGQAQFWPGPSSVIVTEVISQPRKTFLNFFLAAGTLPEIQAMVPGICAWGKSVGCTEAKFIGRKGWARSYLTDDGWRTTDLVVMEKPL